MEYLINMGLTGSVMWIIYLFIKWFTCDKLLNKYRYVMLKCVIFYYLIPIPFMKTIYRFIWKNIVGVKEMQQRYVQYIEDYRVLCVDRGIYISPSLKIQLIVGGIWMSIALVVLIYKMRNYLMQRKLLLRCRKEGVDNTWLEDEINYLQTRSNIKRNIVYIDSTPADVTGKTAFTLGIMKPIVLYPAKRNLSEIRLILEHELQHVKNNDMLWRMLLDIVGIIHFYNPFEWFFAAEFETVSEMACDAKVVQNKDDRKREDYAELLMQMSQEDFKGTVWSAGIGRKKKKVQERVENIMKRERKYFGKMVSGLIVSAAVFASSFTAFAYDDVKVWRAGDTKDIENFFETDVAFVPDGEDGSEISFLRELQVLYDMQFIDEAGNIYEIREDAISTNAVCSHQYVSGTVTKHVLNGTGGCTVKVYSAQRCSKCGAVVTGEILNVVTYNACIH